MNMDTNINNRDNSNLLQHRDEFETVYGIDSRNRHDEVWRYCAI